MDLPKNLFAFFSDPQKIKNYNYESLSSLSIQNLKQISERTIRILQERDIKTLQDLVDLSDLVNRELLQHIGKLELDQAVVIAKILISYAKGEYKEGKIIFTGLDRAGKTSILLTLKNIYHQEKDKGYITPTIGASYERLSLMNQTPLILWDYGGQISFRELYLEDTRYWHKAKLIFHIIDLQDDQRIQQSLNYLSHVLESIMEIRETPYIVITLHKVDPNLYPALQKTITGTKEKVKQIFQKYPYPYKIVVTSIFNRANLLKEFSEAIREISPVTQILEGLLQDISFQIGALVVAIYSKHGFLLAEYSDESFTDKWNSSNVSSKILTGLNDFINLKTMERETMKLASELYYTIIPLELKEVVYSVVVSKTSRMPKEIVTKLKSYLQLWLFNLLSTTR